MKIEVNKTPMIVAREVAHSGDFTTRVTAGCAVMAPAVVPKFWAVWERGGEYPLVGEAGWARLEKIIPAGGDEDHRAAVLDCGDYAVVLRQEWTLHPGPLGWMWAWLPVALVA